jgi:hypothetical protein
MQGRLRVAPEGTDKRHAARNTESTGYLKIIASVQCLILLVYYGRLAFIVKGYNLILKRKAIPLMCSCI